MARKTKAQKQAEEYVEMLVGRALNGNPISVLDIGKVFKKAEALVAQGGEVSAIEDSLLAFVQTLVVKVA